MLIYSFAHCFWYSHWVSSVRIRLRYLDGTEGWTDLYGDPEETHLVIRPNPRATDGSVSMFRRQEDEDGYVFVEQERR